MPDPTLSEVLQEAYASNPTVIAYDTLEFSHPLNAPLRVVRGHRNLLATLEADAPNNPGEEVTFTAYPFDVERPEVGPDSSPELRISIDNVSLEIEEFISRTLASQEVINVIYRSYVEGDLGQPANDPVLVMDVFNIVATTQTITASARVGNYANVKFPRTEYNARDWPGLP